MKNGFIIERQRFFAQIHTKMPKQTQTSEIGLVLWHELVSLRSEDSQRTFRGRAEALRASSEDAQRTLRGRSEDAQRCSEAFRGRSSSLREFAICQIHDVLRHGHVRGVYLGSQLPVDALPGKSGQNRVNPGMPPDRVFFIAKRRRKIMLF